MTETLYEDPMERAKTVWKEAKEAGIRFKIDDKGIRFEAIYNDMHLTPYRNADELDRARAGFQARIRQSESELTKFLMLRTRIDQLSKMLDEYPIDETNRDVLLKFQDKLNTVLSESPPDTMRLCP